MQIRTSVNCFLLFIFIFKNRIFLWNEWQNLWSISWPIIKMVEQKAIYIQIRNTCSSVLRQVYRMPMIYSICICCGSSTSVWSKSYVRSWGWKFRFVAFERLKCRFVLKLFIKFNLSICSIRTTSELRERKKIGKESWIRVSTHHFTTLTITYFQWKMRALLLLSFGQQFYIESMISRKTLISPPFRLHFASISPHSAVQSFSLCRSRYGI